MTERLRYAPLRVDFGGGWLDVPAFARPGAWVVNCAISPTVTLDSWPYEQRGGLGGSAAYALLKGNDAVQEELNRAGWQDPAIIMETGLCVWRSGPSPILEAKINPGFLSGLMAIKWTGKPHDTEIIKVKPRSYDLIAAAGEAAREGVLSRDVSLLAKGIIRSCVAQLEEGMEKLPEHGAIAGKYCGSGWGGYFLYLFGNRSDRDKFVASDVNAKAVEPYLRSVHSSVLLWHE